MDEEEIKAARARVEAGAEKPKVLHVTEHDFIANERAADDPLGRQQRVWWTISWAGKFKSALGWLYLFYVFGALSLLMAVILEVTNAPAQLVHILMPGGTKVIPIPPLIAVGLMWVWTRYAPDRAGPAPTTIGRC